MQHFKKVRLGRRSNMRMGCLGLLVALMVQLLPVQVAMAQTAADVDTAVEDGTIRFEDYVLETVDYTLPNGLRVILAEDSSAPVVAVDIWYHVGGANDPEGRSGFAHLFEHMMFEGSANIADGEWDTLLEPIGARNNAYTANDKTAYWEVAPSHELPRILWMEADRMRSLQVTEESYENQRAVVIQEYNQRVGNAPYGIANLRLFTQPMAGYEPYARPVIGSVEDLQSAPFDEVKAFHDTYYKPNNANLVVVGAINIEQTQALIQAYFADIPSGEEVAPILSEYPLPDEFPVSGTDEETGCLVGTEEVIVDPLVRIPRWAMSVAVPQRGTPDYYALSVLSSILSGGDSSRLQRNIVQQGKAATAFAGLNSFLGTSVFYSAIYPNTGDSLEDMAALLQAELAKIRTEGVTEAELARVKRQVVVGSLTGYRSSVLQTAEWLQDATLAFDTPDSILTELAAYEEVTAEDIQRVAQTYLCERPINVQQTLQSGEEVLSTDVQVEAGEPITPTQASEPEVLVLPESAISALPEGTVTSSEVPAPLGEPTTNFPPFVTFTLENGLEVIFVEQHEVPKVQLQLVVGGSDKAAAPDKQGVADLMTTLLTKGTVKKSAATIAETIEAVGGSISASAALEWTVVSADALTTDTKLVFDLLSEVARYSTFPQAEFDVAKTQTLTFLESDAVNPTSMADRQFSRVAFAGHPYSYIETPETVDSLTRNDIRTFHRTYYRPNNALLIIVGDMTADEAQAQAERAFGMWMPAEVPELFDYPDPEPADTSVIYLVDRPDSEQATIQVGNIAIDARSPDRYALEVVNSLLGTGSSSRLYLNLREEKGYTYSVYSRFARPNDRGTFRVQGDFNPETAGAAIVEILAELEQVQSEPIPEEELENAKGKIIGGFALAMEDPSTFAGQLAVRALTGVPIEELNEYLPSIEAVTAAEAERVAAQYIDAESPIIVVVGNAEVLKPQLEEIMPVRAIDGDGNVMEDAE
jgi:zinc protease